MCLILIAYKTHPDHDLIILSNRDEFYDRQTRPAHFWESHPTVLAGLDERHGGTWLGVTSDGRVAMLTNFREGLVEDSRARSRGDLVREYLTKEKSPDRFLEDVAHDANDFAGFNLVVGDRSGLYYFSNRDDEKRARQVHPLRPGVYGLSNHLLDTPWPKVTRCKKMFSDFVGAHGVRPQPGLAPGSTPSTPTENVFFDILNDAHQPLDEHLPDTGVGLEWERKLAPIFIKTENYGTRTSTVITMSRDEINFYEKTHVGQMGEKEFVVDITK